VKTSNRAFGRTPTIRISGEGHISTHNRTGKTYSESHVEWFHEPSFHDRWLGRIAVRERGEGAMIRVSPPSESGRWFLKERRSNEQGWGSKKRSVPYKQRKARMPRPISGRSATMGADTPGGREKQSKNRCKKGGEQRGIE